MEWGLSIGNALGPEWEPQSHRANGHRCGFSLLEIIAVLAVMSILAGIALPSFARVRRDGSVQNARHMVTSTLSLARATAIGYGRVAALRLDTVAGSLWIEVDTSQAQDRSGLITKGTIDLGSELGISVRSDNDRLCFDGRGLGVATSSCPSTGARIELVHSSRIDTIVVSSVGRVSRGR